MSGNDEKQQNSELQPKVEWNPDLALEACRKLYEPPQRRLTFAERCEILAFAYNGTPNRYLAPIFGVSQTTIANITGCLKVDPTPRRPAIDPATDTVSNEFTTRDHNSRRNPNRSERYEDVRREFEALGEKEFGRRYVTVDNYRRIAEARREEIAARKAKKA